jgi:threonylcarbamoyladenosine tRNA methylthiotransferase MtaB
VKSPGTEAGSVEVLTFGCRLNAVESEAIRRAATAAGETDLVVLNTCAVTTEAVRQAKQAIRRLGRERPQARIVVTGCAAQTEPETFAGMPEVAQVVGNSAKTEPRTWADLPASLRRGERRRVTDIMQPDGDRPLLAGPAAPDSIEGQTRAFVEVQTGCDHRCTFCIIPYGRGPSRSAIPADVVAQVRRLRRNGYREIVLTGVDITSWGHDLPDQPRLGGLVRRILREVPELERLRLSSIDCIEADPDLLEAIACEPRFMPHLHLSLQAGDDLVLKRMKRRHSRAEAVRFCADIRALRPDIVFGADLIAGFPTETEDMFARSLDLVADCGLTHLHVFPFSPRPGTPAARMPQVAREIARERAARLRAAGDAALQRHLAAQVGRRLRVLTERGGLARAQDFTPVRLDRATPHGQIIDVLATGYGSRELSGEPTA